MSEAEATAGEEIRQNRKLTIEEARRHIAEAADRAEDIAATNRAVRKGGFLVGGIGAGIGVLGMLGMVAMALSWPQPEVRITPMVGGELLPAMKPAEAVASFNDVTVRQHLRSYVEWCESYAPQTAELSKNRCLLFLSDREQDEYVKWYKSDPEGLGRFGRDAQVSIADQVGYGKLGEGRDRTFIYQVNFTRIEYGARRAIRCRPWVVRLTFQWHPEFQMSQEDRNWNPGGFQALDRSSGPDTARAEGCTG